MRCGRERDKGSGSGISSKCPPPNESHGEIVIFRFHLPHWIDTGTRDDTPAGIISGIPGQARGTARGLNRPPSAGLLDSRRPGAVCIKSNTLHVTGRENREFRSGHREAPRSWSRAFARAGGHGRSPIAGHLPVHRPRGRQRGDGHKGGLWLPNSTLKLHIGMSDFIQTRAVTRAQGPTGRGWAQEGAKCPKPMTSGFMPTRPCAGPQIPQPRQRRGRCSISPTYGHKQRWRLTPRTSGRPNMSDRRRASGLEIGGACEGFPLCTASDRRGVQ
jgi:hypothetical protein